MGGESTTVSQPVVETPTHSTGWQPVVHPEAEALHFVKLASDFLTRKLFDKPCRRFRIGRKL
jgi:hypothetical protein